MRNEALNYLGTLDTTKYPSDWLQIYQNKLTGFIDRKPVLIAWAKRTVEKKCDGASTNCGLQSWSSRWRKSLVCVHCWRSRRWLRDRFLWWLECGVESPRLWSTRDQGSNIAWSEKKAKKPFPSANNVFALRRLTFTFKYNPNLCKQKSQITVRFNFRREFA